MSGSKFVAILLIITGVVGLFSVVSFWVIRYYRMDDPKAPEVQPGEPLLKGVTLNNGTIQDVPEE